MCLTRSYCLVYKSYTPNASTPLLFRPHNKIFANKGSWFDMRRWFDEQVEGDTERRDRAKKTLILVYMVHSLYVVLIGTLSRDMSNMSHVSCWSHVHRVWYWFWCTVGTKCCANRVLPRGSHLLNLVRAKCYPVGGVSWSHGATSRILLVQLSMYFDGISYIVCIIG